MFMDNPALSGARADLAQAYDDLVYARDTYLSDDPLHYLAIAGLALADIVKLSLGDHPGPKASHQSVLTIIRTIDNLAGDRLACANLPALYTLARSLYIFEATFSSTATRVSDVLDEGEG